MKKVKFLQDKGFAKKGDVWPYPDEVADSLVKRRIAQYAPDDKPANIEKVELKPKKALEDDGNE